MAKRQDLDRLCDVRLFADCSNRELGRIAGACTRVDVSAGKTLLRQGDYAREAFVVVEGEVVVRRNDRKVTELGPGSVVGELGLFHPFERNATVEAKTDAVVLVISPRDFMALLREVPSITRKVMTAMASRVRELDTKAYG